MNPVITKNWQVVVGCLRVLLESVNSNRKLRWRHLRMNLIRDLKLKGRNLRMNLIRDLKLKGRNLRPN